MLTGRDIASEIKKNNIKLNDFTVVYAKEAGPLTEGEKLSVQMMRI